MIGNGSSRDIREFRQLSSFHGTIVTDPERKSYQLLGLRRDLGGIFSLSAMSRAITAFKAGFRQGRMKGDALQLGGALVVAAGGTMRCYFKSQDASDHPSVNDLLACLDDAGPHN